MDREAWRATVYGVAKSQTQLSNSHTHTHTHTHLCNVELFTDIVDVVELKCGIKAFIFFAVTEVFIHNDCIISHRLAVIILVEI